LPSAKCQRSSFIALGVREVQVDEPVVGEPRVERQAEQTALALIGDVDLATGIGAQRAVALEHPDATGSLGDERAAVGQERYLPGHLEALGDNLDLVAGRW
jgi:hypothetical protein